MRFRLVSAAFAALALATISCAGTDVTGPDSISSGAPAVTADVVASALNPIRISEFHYDNVGADTGEAIEVSMPADADTTGYSVVLYNGASTIRRVYATRGLGSGITTACTDGERQVVVLTHPGIENGAPDGIALVGPGGVVIEFISYEGFFTAADGPAIGMTSVDIGVDQDPAPAIGSSLQLNTTGTWVAAASTFGQCNDTQVPPPEVVSVDLTPSNIVMTAGESFQFTGSARDAGNQPIPGVELTWSSSDETIATVSSTGVVTAVVPGNAVITATAPNGPSDNSTVEVIAGGLPATRFSELHYDNSGTDLNEAIEIEGPAGTSVVGWQIVLYNGNGGVVYGTEVLAVSIPLMCDGRGVVFVPYPTDGIQNGSPDGMALVDAEGTVVEFLSYEGRFIATDGPAAGMLSRDIGVAEAPSSPVGSSLHRDATGAWQAASPADFGACNSGEGPPAPPPGNNISITGRTIGDPPLPVGFQDQLFARLVSPTGTEIATEFTWTSETPALASIDADGVMTALASGIAVFRATATDGSTRAFALPTVVATFSGVTYPGNAEFGEPADGTPADDFILEHTTFTASYSSVRGTPNWVSYNLDASHIGSQDRCDCFTFDPALPGSYTRYTTADYTGAGEFHGYGIDRGHMARSFDRTTGNLDNAYTYYFSNIVPQAADQNQGPWANLENFLGNLATAQNKEVYIIAGVAGNKGTVKDEGLIVIPEYTWKVAVIMPRDQGLDDIDDYQDLEVMAVIMPNVPGIRSVDWQTYLVTVDAVEALSGYDILDLLPDPVEIAVESATAPPVAVVDGPYAALEDEAIAMSAAGSSDPDSDVLTYAWDFGDGSTGTGVSVSHAYASPGTYQIQLVVTDVRGLADTVVTQAVIQSLADAAADAIVLVQQLKTDGKLNNGNANGLISKLEAAIQSLENGNDGAAVGQLNALLNQLDDFEESGNLSAADAAELRALVTRIIQSASQ